MKHKVKQPSGRLQKKLLLDYFLPLGLYSGALIAFAYIALLWCYSRIWLGTSKVYQILKFFDLHFVSVFCIVLLTFWVIYTYRFIRKILGYLNEVADAAEQLAEPSNQPIELSPNMGYLENDLNRVREQAFHHLRAAKDAEQRKNDLVVFLAHDLKTPLTSVIGYLSLLNDEHDISPALREKYLGIALRKAERLEDLINEFFDITRFNLSELSLEYGTVNMSRLLEQLVFEFQPMLQEKRLTCALETEPDMLLSCDGDKMQRVLDNLLRNAVSYSYPNTEIVLRAEKAHDSLKISVINHGNTIPREKLDRIFEQFFRVDASRSSGTGGAGLGLAIAKEIVERHGGTISASSENERITFTLSIPLK